MDESQFQFSHSPPPAPRFLDSWLQRLKRLEAFYSERPLPPPALSPVEFPFVRDPASVRRLLVFKPDDIGDAVCALPALQQLRTHFRHAHLTVLCQKKTQAIYSGSGLCDEIIAVAPRTRALRFSHFDVKQALVGRESFDLAIFLRTYRGFFGEFKRVPARYHLHPQHRAMPSQSAYQVALSLTPQNRPHQTELLLEIASAATGAAYGEAAAKSFPLFQWGETDRDLSSIFPQGIPPRYWVVHPFNRYETKRYPYAYWPHLLFLLSVRFEMPIVFIGGPEDEKFDPIPGVVQAQGLLSLGQTGFLLQNARGFLGNESGPGHWAAALGVPTITLMGGHSSSTEWAPVGNTLTLTTEVPCSPCHRKTCAEFDVACLKLLQPKTAFRSIHSFFSKALKG